ncbi:pregnancy-specific beta-1-glycoprotein 8-like [Gigantopelta aegis]|uniref:pregnancy-specific beta-1-glycoprotein 8-like n=1 Tax=Gigantopelta aegis TaxID=1735272 RepID=UPI001B88B3B0|nr:pregnancy-specific beta-1-glycoprotein 8-like [Gigantopelta aegis]
MQVAPRTLRRGLLTWCSLVQTVTMPRVWSLCYIRTHYLIVSVAYILTWNHFVSVSGYAETTVDCMNGGYPGNSTMINCTVTGDIEVGIIWFRPNGGSPQKVIICDQLNTKCEQTDLVTGDKYKADIYSTHNVLTINSFNTNTDAGEWTCGDGINGDSCMMSVLHGPDPSSITFSSTISVDGGNSLDVDCAVDCKPPCDYVWTLGDNQITTRPLLTLRDMARNMDGNVYTCTVTNSAIPKSISKDFTLSLYSTSHANTTVDCMNGGYPGKTTKINCTLNGNVKVGIIWFRPNGGSPQKVITCDQLNTKCEQTDLVTGDKYKADIYSTHNVLTINSFNVTTDAGEWTCGDGIKGVSCMMSVLYGPDPSSITFSSTINANGGRYLAVDCAVDCNPPCDYAWTLGDNKITTSPLLTLRAINWDLDGNVYTCTVTNSAIPESISKDFTLRLYSRPELMHSLSTSAILGIVICVTLALAIPSVWITYKRKIQKKENEDRQKIFTAQETQTETTFDFDNY